MSKENTKMKNLSQTLTTLAREIHADNVAAGWWDEYPNKQDRYETAMMLVISEIAEAMEGHRKGLMDDHLPDHKMFDVELADAMIRLLDLAGAYPEVLAQFEQPKPKLPKFGFFTTYTPRPEETLETLVGLAASSLKEKTPPEQLFWCIKHFGWGGASSPIHMGTLAIIAIAQINSVDIFHLIELKRAYNKQRADHKRETRNAKGGKKY